MRGSIEHRVLTTLIRKPEERNLIDELKLAPKDFANDRNKKVFELIVKQLGKGRKVDLKTLNAIDPELIKPMVKELVETSPDIKSDIGVLKDERGKSEIYSLSEGMLEQLVSDKDAVEIAHDTIQTLEGLIEDVSNYEDEEPYQVALKTIKMNERNAEIGYQGILTGYDKIDSKSHGFRPHDLTVLAAGSGEGKTTFSLNCAVNAALRGVPTLFFTVEMTKHQLWNKIFGMYLPEPYHEIEEGKVDFHKVPGEVLRMPMHIEGGAGLSINDVMAVSKSKIRKFGVELIFIDYLQVIDPGRHSKYTTTEEDLGYMSGKCKELALATGTSVVLLSQLNRLSAGSHRYELHHLRGSGKIGMDADNVLFIYRPAAHMGDEFESFSGEMIECDSTESIVYRQKARFGDLFEARLNFDTTYGRFIEKVPS